MPRTDYDEVYEDGVLVSRTPRVVSDVEIALEEAGQRIQEAITAIDAALNDPTWTTAEAQQHLRLVLRVQRAMIRRMLRR